MGIWTIGVGLTRVHGRPVWEGDILTQEESDKFLMEELEDFKAYVEKYSNRVGYYWNENQIDALTSFIFNLGKGRLNQLTHDGTRSDEVIADKMLLYRKAGGRVLKGLERRRKAESEHFKS